MFIFAIVRWKSNVWQLFQIAIVVYDVYLLKGFFFANIFKSNVWQLIQIAIVVYDVYLLKGFFFANLFISLGFDLGYDVEGKMSRFE